ncbi:hypothetical protein FBZ93_116137 [Bradyrhizobium macuxiense]|uniref:Response regulatory domain-containing protein n=1 Tax=Bradyrhizobium macuxiense TaxID=1755647 RepID=A0A560L8D0_9BRAD|nr:hypothetical protein [Bradyrhizobium macuxiense]TWB89420.1 hypothetical protein FBZ93_116137 [Bradyrhizobium macuxiense]
MQVGSETSTWMDQRPVFVIDDDEIARAALRFMSHDGIETHQLTTPENAPARGVDWPEPNVVLLGGCLLEQKEPAPIGEMAAQCPGVRIPIVCDASDEATTVGGITDGAPDVRGKPSTLTAVRNKVDAVLECGGVAPIAQPGALE